MIKFVHKGDFSRTKKFLNKNKDIHQTDILEKYGMKGVAALAAATPIDTGKTASSWSYDIEDTGDSIHIYWTNTNINNYVNVALILQYGHGTGTGGYVEGIDYINPALRPIFDSMINEFWKEVTA